MSSSITTPAASPPSPKQPERGATWHEGVVTTAAGRRIGYLARGPEHGRPVLYLHGAPGSRYEQRVLPEEVLARFGLRMISIDRPGYGESDPLAGDRIARAADVLALCDALDVRSFTVVAVSSGGSYALALAAAAPERVERVVLVSAQMPYDDQSAIRGLLPAQRALLPALREGRTEQLVAGVEDARAAMLADPVAAIEQIATLSDAELTWLAQPRVAELVVDDVREGLRLRADGLLDDLLSWPHSLEVDAGDVHCAVRAVHGTLDDAEPLENLRRVLRGLGDARLFLLDGLSHLGPLLHPDLIVSLAAGTE